MREVHVTLTLAGHCLLVVFLQAVLGLENYQLWSEQAYIGDGHILACVDTRGEVQVASDDTLIWTKLGHSEPITSDERHLLRERDGVENLELVVLAVTEESAGIYICHVTSSDGQTVGRIVKGLNIHGHLYEHAITKYRTSIIIGFFTAFIVFAIVGGSCFVLNLDYCSPEQRARRRRLAEEGEAQQKRFDNMGVVNYGLTSSSSISHVSGSRPSVRELSM